MDPQTRDSFVSVSPAKAGIQNRVMPQDDLGSEPPWIPAFAGMVTVLSTLSSITTTVGVVG